MNKYYIYIILFFEVFILKNIFGKITNNKIILKDEYKKQIDNVSYSIVFDGEIYNKKFKDIEKRPIFFELDFLNLLPS